MEFTFNSAKITTESSDLNWSGVFAENGFFVALEVLGSSGKKADILGREYLDLLLSEFTNFQKRNLSVVNELLNKLKTKENIASLVLGLNYKNFIYLGSLGKGETMLRRGDKVGKILTFGETTSGEVKTGDILFLYSERLQNNLPEDLKTGIFRIGDLEDIQNKIISNLFENKDAAGCAVLCLQVEKIVEEVEVEQPEIPTTVREIIAPQEKISILERIKTFVQNIKVRRLPAIYSTFQSWWKKTLQKNEETPKSKKNLLIVSFALIFLLTLSIFFNISHNQSSKRNKELGTIMELVSQQYDEAVSLIDINPVRARELLSTSKLSLTPYLTKFPKKTDEYKKVKELLDKIQTQEITAYKIYKLTAVPLFFDLTFLKKEALGDKISSYKDVKAILDTKNQVVYTLSTTSKKGELVAGSDVVKDARALALHGNNVFLLNGDGIVSIDIESKTAKVAIKPDEKWGVIKTIASFAGNLYLLDTQGMAIWKYIAADFGFSARSNYLNPDVKVDLGSANNMVIDGSVYVTTAQDILKFTRGLPEQFSFTGISDTISNIAEFSTSDLDNSLYILDKSLSRIVVFDKSGTYLAQYQWDELKNAQGIVASEEEKKIYVLAGSKIYAIDTK